MQQLLEVWGSQSNNVGKFTHWACLSKRLNFTPSTLAVGKFHFCHMFPTRTKELPGKWEQRWVPWTHPHPNNTTWNGAFPIFCFTPWMSSLHTGQRSILPEPQLVSFARLKLSKIQLKHFSFPVWKTRNTQFAPTCKHTDLARLPIEASAAEARTNTSLQRGPSPIGGRFSSPTQPLSASFATSLTPPSDNAEGSLPH